MIQLRMVGAVFPTDETPSRQEVSRQLLPRIASGLGAGAGDLTLFRAGPEDHCAMHPSFGSNVSPLLKTTTTIRRLWGYIGVLGVALACFGWTSGSASERYLDLSTASQATTGWGQARDGASADGAPLRIGSVDFDQGIGVHAPSTLVFPLGNEARWLTFYAGISSRMTEKGSVQVQVWLDGRLALTTETLRVGSEPGYYSLPISGAKELRIVGTDAGDGIAADHLNLCNLRVSTDAIAPGPDSAHSLVFTHDAPAVVSPSTLWYRRPAKRWLEALPVGNGRLGAMVFGGVQRERIALNESTFWSGAPDLTHENPSGRGHLQEIRTLLFAGKFREATDLMQRHLLGRQGNYGTHLPVGDLLIEMEHPQEDVSGYVRELALDEASATVEYKMGRTRYRREVVASNPEGVIAVRLTADRPGALSFRVRIKGAQESTRVTSEGTQTLRFTADARESKHSNGKSGVSLAGRIRAEAKGGTVSTRGDAIEVTGATAATLWVAMATTFTENEPSPRCDQQIAKASAISYATLRRRHVQDHQALYRRVALELGTSSKVALATDERLARVRRGAEDPELSALFFQYGRYLLIAGSRPDSPLPTNLQGIWNDNIACNMGWTCDFHLDINTQQNYWPAEVANLSECHEPLFRLIDSLRAPGRRTANLVYGARGWVCHVFTNPWGFTAPGWSLGWGLHPTGGIWIATHLWERYLFTRDRAFLHQQAYPIMKEAAEFFLDYMVKHPKHGWLVTGPSTSPENSFRAPNGGDYSESMGPTCDMVLVRELFTACIESSRMLNRDDELRARLEAARALLPPLRIGRHGQLMEWLEDFEEAAPNHRHTSHLIALHPAAQITPRSTPELARAARVTIDRRLGQPNWEDVEWSRGNLINYHARLGDGEAAHHHLLGLLRHDTELDLLTYSRGGIAGAQENVFCVDGNSAGTAGIAEMLLQSHGGEIELLPALPKAWPKGRVRGLRARGNVTVDFDWKDGKVVSFRLTSPDATAVPVRFNGVVRKLVPKPPSSKTFDTY